MKYFKLAVFWLLVVPLAFMWDVLFYLVKVLNKACTYIDENGLPYLERVKERLLEE